MLSTIDILREIKSVRILIAFLRVQIGLMFLVLGVFRVMVHDLNWVPDYAPVANFVEAMTQVGFFGNFMGPFLIITGFFLISQRFATLGSILLIPILFSVLVRSFSLDLKEAIFLSCFVFFNVLLFILWDYEKVKPIFNYDTSIRFK